MKKGQTGRNLLFFLIIAPVSLLLLWMTFITTVGLGERGVMFNRLGGTTYVLEEGLHVKIPLIQSSQIYDVTITKYQTNASAASKDLQDVMSVVSLNYRLDPVKVEEIAKRVGPDYENALIMPAIQETVKAVTAKYTADKIITERASVKNEIVTMLEKRLNDYGIQVVDFNTENFEFSASFNEAINKKVTAEQEALAAENQLKVIEYQEHQKVIIAQKEAEALITKTNATAQAKIITAEADTKVFELLQQKLTPEVIEKIKIDKWDGKLPIVTSGNTLFNLGGNPP